MLSRLQLPSSLGEIFLDEVDEAFLGEVDEASLDVDEAWKNLSAYFSAHFENRKIETLPVKTHHSSFFASDVSLEE